MTIHTIYSVGPKHRYASTEVWESINPVLGVSELGIEVTSTGQLMKIGDGLTAWNDLDYVGAGSGGVTDHGLLTGLADDDHPQYHNDARGDARYPPLTRTISTTAPLTGGGDLLADRTLAISPATTVAAGSMSAADKTKLDGLTQYTDAAARAAVVIDSIADADTTHAPSRNAVFDALALKADASTVSGLVIDSIADSDTTHAPSRNAVFDALALKGDASGPGAAVTDNAVARWDGTTGKLLQNSTATLGDLGQFSGYSSDINAQTGTTYTLTLTDSGKVVTLNNAAAITLTLPNSFPIGWCCTVVQKGAGQVTFTAAAGATRNNRSGHTKTAGQYAMTTLYVDSNGTGTTAVWFLGGDTAA